MVLALRLLKAMNATYVPRNQIYKTLKCLYDQGDYSKADKLLSQQKYFLVQGMIQNAQLRIDFEKLLSFKTNFDLYFRKYEHIYTNIENQLYLLKESGNADPLRLTTMYNAYILIALLHDYKRLRNLLTPTKNSSLIKSIHGEYIAMSERPQYLFNCIHAQALGYAVLNEPKEAVRLLSCHLKQKQLLFWQREVWNVLLITVLSMGQAKTVAPLNQMHQIKDCLSGNPSEITNWFPLKPEQTQELINYLLINRTKCKWQTQRHKDLRFYYRLLYFLAENYYLHGDTHNSDLVVSRLESALNDFVPPIATVSLNSSQIRMVAKLTLMQKNMRILLRYLKCVKLYDAGQFKKCIKECQEELAQFHPQTIDYHQLYAHALPEMDVVRKRILKLYSKASKKDKGWSDEKIALQIQNMSPQQISQHQEEETDSIADNFQVVLNVAEANGLSPFYCLLPHQDTFQISWDQVL